jgi:phosphomannomutase
MQKTSIIENEDLARAATSLDPDSDDGYFSKLASYLKRSVDVPQVKISYRNLKVVVDATTSANALPSIPNVLRSMGKVSLFIHCTLPLRHECVYT